jgi:hypothetical protein
MALEGVMGGLLNTALTGAKSTLAANPLGLAVGAGQLALGAIQNKKAKGMLPSPEDVGERALLNTLRRRQQALSTGTAYNPQAVAGQQMAKAMQRNAFAAGGPVNMGMYSNLMSQTMGNIAQQTSQDIAQNLGQQGQLVKDMANRKADLQLLEYTNKKATAADLTKSGFQNVAASVMPGNEDQKSTDETDSSELSAIKKKMKELEEQQKKAAEAAAAGNPQ